MSVQPSGFVPRVTPSNLPSSAWNGKPAANRARASPSPAQQQQQQQPVDGHGRSAVRRLPAPTANDSQYISPPAAPSQPARVVRPGGSPQQAPRTVRPSTSPVKKAGQQRTRSVEYPTNQPPPLAPSSFADQYAALQEQHSQLSTAIHGPARASPFGPSSVATGGAASSSSSSSLKRPHERGTTPQPTTLLPHSANSSGAPSRARTPTVGLTRARPAPQLPLYHFSEAALDEHEHELAIISAESAANAPHPLTASRAASPTGAASPYLGGARQPPGSGPSNAVLQSELSALDHQIREQTQELLVLQQKQQLQSIQQQQQAIQNQIQQQQQGQAQHQQAQPYAGQVQQAQQRQAQLQQQHQLHQQQLFQQQQQQHQQQQQQALQSSFPQSQPGSAAAWFRPASPRASPVVSLSPLLPSSNFRSHPPSVRPPSVQPAVGEMLAGSPLATVPPPQVSKNNPFGSLVDAIDSVLAKAGATPHTHHQEPNSPARHQDQQFVFAQQTPMPHNQQQQQQQQYQAWMQQQQPPTQQQPQYQQPPPQPQFHSSVPKSQMQLLSETSVSLSDAGSLSNTQSLASYSGSSSHPLSSAAHASVSFSPGSSSDALSIAAAAAAAHPDEEPLDPAETGGAFDDHPELAQQSSMEALKLSNLLLRDKGALLLKKHSALRLKFQAVRSLLGEYYRRKDRELAILKLGQWLERKTAKMQERALTRWQRSTRGESTRDARKKAALRSVLRFSVASAHHTLSARLRSAFARWKEVAIRLAMRAVQNQWMADWEADIQFEARRTALAGVVLAAGYRQQRDLLVAQAKRFHTWKMHAVYARVKTIFSAHSGNWTQDRQALLQLVLEANESREALARQADRQQAEHDQLKGQYAQLAHIALQNNELVQHIAQLHHESSQMKHQAEERKKVTHERAAKVLASAVWAVRCNRVRKALWKWAIQHNSAKQAERRQRQQQQEAYMAAPQFQTMQQQQQQQQLAYSAASVVSGYPTPPRATVPSHSHQATPGHYPAGSLQQLANQPQSPTALAAGGPQDPRDIDAKLAEFEAAKVQLEQETQSLAARLAATRRPMATMNANGGGPTMQQSFAGQQTHHQQEPQPQQQQQQSHFHQQSFYPPQSQPAASSVAIPSYAPAPTAAQVPGPHASHPPALHQSQSLSRRGSLTSVSLEQYAPSAGDLSFQAAEESFVRSPAQPMPNGRLPMQTAEIIQPPLTFDTPGQQNRTAATAAAAARPPMGPPQPTNLPPPASVAVPVAHSKVTVHSLPPRVSSVASVSPSDPARASLLSSVFLDFSRAYSLRRRALDSTALVDGQLAVEDVGKALRKLGLRAGDLATAKMNDATVHQWVATRGWSAQATIREDEFQELANEVLFRQ